MINRQDNADMFKEAYCIGQEYFGHSRVVIFPDHITVIAIGITTEYERVEVCEHVNMWYYHGWERVFRAKKIFT